MEGFLGLVILELRPGDMVGVGSSFYPVLMSREAQRKRYCVAEGTEISSVCLQFRALLGNGCN